MSRPLAQVRSIAVLAVSRRKSKFGSVACRELKKRGYVLYPVHNSLEMFDGETCYRSLTDIPVPPDCVLVTVRPEAGAGVVDQALAKGAKIIWFQQGADFSDLADQAETAGLQVIRGKCILMYAEPVKGLHRFHRFLWKMIGKY